MRLMRSDRISQRKETQQGEKRKNMLLMKHTQQRNEYVTKQYQTSSELQQKKKNKITTQQKENFEFRQRQMQYITKRYKQSVDFRQRQKEYYTNQYRQNDKFKQQRQSYITQLYANDQTFRVRHRELMKQRMRDMYKNNLSYKMRCALRITRKYRQIINPTHEDHRGNENPLIAEAISIFRSHIQAGPTYVCTVCHKVSFPNQVKPCKRSSYVRNPDVVATCLTGKYVHVCDDECRNKQCTVPDQRKSEWICFTCDNNLKNGVMPTLGVANNLQLAEIPPELLNLNILERHLVAKCITFAKIFLFLKADREQYMATLFVFHLRCRKLSMLSPD